jgi:hypothetical protein
LAPAKNATLSFLERLSPIELEWDSSGGDAASLASHSVEFSKAADFPTGRLTWSGATAFTTGDDPAVRRYRGMIDDPALLTQLQDRPGDWHWRVCAQYKNGDGVVCSADKGLFRVARAAGLVAPEAHLPRDGKQEVVGDAPLRFSWAPVAEAARYKFFLWAYGTMRPADPLFVTSKNYIEVSESMLPSGHLRYLWSVVAVGAGGEAGGFSKNRSISLFAKEPPAIPMLAEPAHGAQKRVAGASVVKFGWVPTDPGHHYLLEVEERVGEKDWKLAYRKETDTGISGVEWSASPGAYRWSMQAIDGLGRAGSRSAYREFELLAPPVKLQAPKLTSAEAVER